MSETIAQPIVDGKFWVVKQNNQKIGSVIHKNANQNHGMPQATTWLQLVEKARLCIALN